MNRLRSFIIPENCDEMTVKAFVRGNLGVSARALTKQKYMENGILLNGQPCKAIQTVHTGDILSFLLPIEAPEYEPVPGTLAILYEDENFLAVNKPDNMPVHPSPGHDRDSLLNVVAYHYAQQHENYRFRPLYRLDKDTSGIVCIAKNRMAASSTVIEKQYFGICQGILVGQGRIDVPIGRKEGSKIVREIGHGQDALTSWKALCCKNDHTLVRFQLQTGRTHQIRVHVSGIGYPLAGDDLYGGSQSRIGRQALHCGHTHLTCRAFQLDMHCDCGYPSDIVKAFYELLAFV